MHCLQTLTIPGIDNIDAERNEAEVNYYDFIWSRNKEAGNE